MGRCATTIFSATQRCNIVATLFRITSSIVPTLQRFVPLKIVVENRLDKGVIYQKIDKLFEELEFNLCLIFVWNRVGCDGQLENQDWTLDWNGLD